jgi:hypothetical protein
MPAHSPRTREDTSNYWTASIYFKSPENGTYRKVPQMANGRLNGTLLEQDGGLTAYYMRPFGGTNKNTTAMKPVSLGQPFSECIPSDYDRASACLPAIPPTAARTAPPLASAIVVSKLTSASWVAQAHPVVLRTLPASPPHRALGEFALQ